MYIYIYSYQAHNFCELQSPLANLKLTFNNSQNTQEKIIKIFNIVSFVQNQLKLFKDTGDTRYNYNKIKCMHFLEKFLLVYTSI